MKRLTGKGLEIDIYDAFMRKEKNAKQPELIGDFKSLIKEYSSTQDSDLQNICIQFIGRISKMLLSNPNLADADKKMIGNELMKIIPEPSNVDKAIKHLKNGDIGYVTSRIWQKYVQPVIPTFPSRFEDMSIVQNESYKDSDGIKAYEFHGVDSPTAYWGNMVICAEKSTSYSFEFQPNKTGNAGKIITEFTSTYSTENGRLKGLVLWKGDILNVFPEDWQGIGIIDDKGTISIQDKNNVNLLGKSYDLSTDSDLIDFVRSCSKNNLNVFQGHLLINNGHSTLHENASKEYAYRRILFQTYNKETGVLYLSTPLSFEQTNEFIFKLFGKLGIKIEKALNLDTGGCDYQTMNHKGKLEQVSYMGEGLGVGVIRISKK